MYTPLALVFPQTRWNGRLTLEHVISGLWLLDVCVVKTHTTYKKHGYQVEDVRKITGRYLRSYFFLDFISAFPFSAVVDAAGLDPHDLNSPACLFELLSLLRTVRLIRYTVQSHGRGAAVFQIVAMVYGVLLTAHLCGLAWYAASILPLERALAAAGPEDWNPLGDEDWWLDDDDPYAVGVRYVCSLYWALSVMTSLKSNAAHESRQCLYHTDDLVTNPLLERWIAIIVYIVGALALTIYNGVMFQFVVSLGSENLRYRKKMGEIKEFARFHSLPRELASRVVGYVDFVFSVTNGIDVEHISEQLPANLQLEIQLVINKKMVEQVKAFEGSPKAFFEVLVMKLSPIMCLTDDHVFYHGEQADRMYFVKKGLLEVRKRGILLSVLNDGDYFGEMALLEENATRSADIACTSDCMLLSLTKEDFDAVLAVYPAVGERIRNQANERARILQRRTSEASLTLGPRSFIRRTSNSSLPTFDMANIEAEPGFMSSQDASLRARPSKSAARTDCKAEMSSMLKAYTRAGALNGADSFKPKSPPGLGSNVRSVLARANTDDSFNRSADSFNRSNADSFDRSNADQTPTNSESQTPARMRAGNSSEPPIAAPARMRAGDSDEPAPSSVHTLNPRKQSYKQERKQSYKQERRQSYKKEKEATAGDEERVPKQRRPSIAQAHNYKALKKPVLNGLSSLGPNSTDSSTDATSSESGTGPQETVPQSPPVNGGLLGGMRLSWFGDPPSSTSANVEA